jgi:hypothetical protein
MRKHEARVFELQPINQDLDTKEIRIQQFPGMSFNT